MWFETLPDGHSWASLWYNYILCGKCAGIATADAACPACGATATWHSSPKIVHDGEDVSTRTFMGAEGRFEDWIFLGMLEREWHRRLEPEDYVGDTALKSRPSPRAAIVVTFWAYFETRIERLLRSGMHDLAGPIVEELLSRNAGIGRRLDHLYRVVFQSTYHTDLELLGFSKVAALLRRIQDRRNRFAHGEPEAIDDDLVVDVVSSLKDEHEAWVAVYNSRAARV